MTKSKQRTAIKVVKENIQRVPVLYAHKEDIGFSKLIFPLACFVAVQKRTEKRRIGFLVGTGAVLSIAPYIGVDEWWMIDNNTFVLDWMKASLNTLSRNTTPERYEKEIYGNHIAQEARYKGIEMHDGLRIEKDILGALHFLSDHKKYGKAREALRQIHLRFFQGDLAAITRVEEIAQTLQIHNAEIVYADVTDLHVFNLKTLYTLPIIFTRRDIVIAWAAKERHGDKFPTAHMSIGFPHYRAMIEKIVKNGIRQKISLISPMWFQLSTRGYLSALTI